MKCGWDNYLLFFRSVPFQYISIKINVIRYHTNHCAKNKEDECYDIQMSTNLKDYVPLKEHGFS